MNRSPFFSFCISTFRRPDFLLSQVRSLLNQTYPNFEIVISDNDPDSICGKLMEDIGDNRIKYFRNENNLGMIPSFNRSISRAVGEYITMVTDDDPVDVNFLDAMYKLIQSHPGFGLYAGFLRRGLKADQIEVLKGPDFLREILDPNRTPWFLWSSCTIHNDILASHKIPDYGSPHLADHAFIAIAGSIKGAVLRNRAYSSLYSHESNFSKFNFEAYVNGCEGFHRTLIDFCRTHTVSNFAVPVVEKHLHQWFVTCFSNLRSFYTKMKNKDALKDINRCAEAILLNSYMAPAKRKYWVKTVIFKIKNLLSRGHL